MPRSSPPKFTGLDRATTASRMSPEFSAVVSTANPGLPMAFIAPNGEAMLLHVANAAVDGRDVFGWWC